MTSIDSQIAALEDRRNRLKQNRKNVDSPGVIRKIDRQIRNLRKQKED